MPFCAASCPYCNYPHAAGHSREAREAFVETVLAEIRRRRRFHGARVRTMYLGGGTPSQLSAGHLGRLLDALREAFDCAGVREITLEANPDDLARPYLKSLRTLGVDRLSLGVQSFFAEDLRALSRRHDAQETARAVPRAQEAGFQNVSVDLMFGIPEQPRARWQATLEKVVQQAPAHVTLYRLTAEPGTLPRGLPSANAASAQYEQALDVLGAAGYRLYEQTHLARPGFEARHTPRYWRHETVLGFGPGAHSFFWKAGECEAVRRANEPSFDAYAQALTAGEPPPHAREVLSRQALADEYLAQRLRTARGLSLQHLKERYGRDLRAEKEAMLDRLCTEGYVEVCRGDRLRLTRAGRLRLDALTAALL